MVTRRIPDPKIGGSIPSGVIFFFCSFFAPKAFLPKIRGSIVVSIPACHAGNPGSIPGLGAFL